ncbi:MAG: hypothetical protein K8S13_15235 [Desulfobacula sp.]|uniref:hypothetical protein n=1 Tax=Desulfobacula sp. TaxID=2593537 RepID=UPI0025BE69B1|nr:hypothetical protein [Desulfobacula sp.]MCD4721192.1 hypothetical protein [Desulfobacula sp.]
MEGYLPNKDLIFFNPGNSGIVFIHPAKHYITVEQLLKAQECLVQETTNPVVYIEDRRAKQRRQRVILTDSPSRSKGDRDSEAIDFKPSLK